ncbi:hypothetical protein [Streptomyces neyagawaensis]|uniref:Transposase n=1 Tax=Streptomyces neyagawaensis TaxID=42238 RepID=A0ABV3B2D2_9ACTN
MREDAGRDPEPTAAIVDSQSVRATATVPTSSRGYDAGKKVPGRSRRLVRDYETLPAAHEQMALWSMAMLMTRRLARRRG